MASFIKTTSLIEMVKSAEAVQARINDWPIAWRQRIPDHEKLLARTLHRANLETSCTVCGAVMDTTINPIECVLCGSLSTCSPYFS